MLAQGKDSEALWQTLTPAHLREVAQFLTDFDEAAPPIFPVEHWRKVKEELVALKHWFRDR